MKKLGTFAALAILVVVSTARAGAQTTRAALKGFDPILLAQGKEVRGRDNLSSTFQKLTYIFANEADKKTFDAAPAEHAVQFGGVCIHVPRMKGDPNLYLVHDHKIYLAGSPSCLDAAKADITGHIKAAELALKDIKLAAIMIFPNVEDIDYGGPVEVLNAAGYKIVTVAATSDPIHTVAGLEVTPDYTFADLPPAEVIVLPGGGVPYPMQPTEEHVQWVAKAAKSTPHILSVCNGAFWLATAGLLDGKEATTTFGNLPLLKMFPNVKVRGDMRFTDNGQIITSAGLSSGIDGALHLVEKTLSAEDAHQIALNLEYNWQPANGFVRGAFADRNLLWMRPAGVRRILSSSNVSKQDGDKDRWTVTWEIDPKGTTAEDLRAKFPEAANKQHWAVVNTSGSTTTYKFTDEDGKDWRAVVTLDQSDAAKYLFTIELQKQMNAATGSNR